MALVDAATAVRVEAGGMAMMADEGVLAVEMAKPSEESEAFRSAAFGCWPMTGLDCDCASQAFMPSCHEWSRFRFPPPPQRLNQEPSWPQQLALPDFWMVPHAGHAGLPVVGVAAGIYM